MRIASIQPQANWVLETTAEDDRVARFGVCHYFGDEAFADLRMSEEFLLGEGLRCRRAA